MQYRVTTVIQSGDSAPVEMNYGTHDDLARALVALGQAATLDDSDPNGLPATLRVRTLSVRIDWVPEVSEPDDPQVADHYPVSEETRVYWDEYGEYSLGDCCHWYKPPGNVGCSGRVAEVTHPDYDPFVICEAHLNHPETRPKGV